MTTTASVQDIDSFIRLQKEKLSREKNSNGYQSPQQQNTEIDFHKRLDNYLNLPRTFDNYEPKYNIENITNNNTSIPNNPMVDDFTKQPQSQMRDYSNERNQNQNNRQYKENNDPQGNFIEKFGTKYEAQKSKLKNDLHQEYNEYLQKKSMTTKANRNKPPINDEYYATLPLKGMDSAKERAKKQRNYEYQLLQNKLEHSEKARRIEWWKDRNSPVIKPYSVSYENDREPSQDIISARRLQTHDNRYQYEQPQHQQQQQQQHYNPPPQPIVNYRAPPPPQINQSNSYENIRQMPMDAWRSPVPPVQMQPVGSIHQMPQMVDASLADILRRPPVGYKPQQYAAYPPANNPMMNNDSYEPSFRYPQSQSPSYPAPPMISQMNNYPQPIQNNYSNNNNSNNTNRNTSRKSDGPFAFSEDQAKDLKAQKAREYQEELQKQVREKQIQKQREKEESEKLDQKMFVESSSYNPYGRGGGGAPIKDRDGNVVANLAQIKADPNQFSPRDMPPPKSYSPPVYNKPIQYPSSQNQFGNNNYGQSNSNDNLMQQFGLNIGKNEEQGFARGGNGIFGEGKSDEQKRQQEKYQSELQKQIEEKKRQKEEEKERQRIEDEKEYKRIMEQQQRIKAELEDEERKKKIKEEQGRKIADDAKRLADEKKRQENVPSNKKSNQVKQMNKKFQRANNTDNNSIQESQLELQNPVVQEFRSNSPPVPAAAKKMNDGQKKSKTIANPKQTPNYYVTESRLNLNLASPVPINENSSNPQLNNNDRPFSGTDFQNKAFNKGYEMNPNNDSNLPIKPVIRKTLNRSPSEISNNEVLTQLKNLKKHLHKEQMQVENQLNNANNRTTIGQMSDIRQSILNVKTPPGDRNVFYSAIQKEPASIRRDNSDLQRTYRKYIDTPPIQGGLEPRTYYRDNTVLLDNQKNDIFHNDLQKQAHERQVNRHNMMNFQIDNADDQLTASNQQRLKKLRDIEDDNLSLADPNEVLNKFLSRNNRQPSAATLNDDTWLRNPA